MKMYISQKFKWRKILVSFVFCYGENEYIEYPEQPVVEENTFSPIVGEVTLFWTVFYSQG